MGHRGPILPRAGRDLLLREMKFAHETIECAGLFHGIQIFALYVFNQRDFERGFIADLAYDRRHAGQAGSLCSTPASLPCQKLEA
jgi:hypothetical protein